MEIDFTPNISIQNKYRMYWPHCCHQCPLVILSRFESQKYKPTIFAKLVCSMTVITHKSNILIYLCLQNENVLREVTSLQHYQRSREPDRIAPHRVLSDKTYKFKDGIRKIFYNALQKCYIISGQAFYIYFESMRNKGDFLVYNCIIVRKEYSFPHLRDFHIRERSNEWPQTFQQE